MKRAYIILTIVIAVILFFVSSNGKTVTPISSTTPGDSPALTPTPVTKEKYITYNNETYAYAYFQGLPKQLMLIPNFEDRLASHTIADLRSCVSSTNGSFYDTENRPLGYFKTDNETIRGPVQNALLNGFFSVDSQDIARIDFEEPTENSRIILQAGPMLIAESNPLPLRIKNDEHARRMVAAISTSGKVVFFTLYTSENTFEGPLLGDTPEIVQRIDKEESLSIISAINLDGGSASTFLTTELTLQEFTPVGSIFCMKNNS
jgi:uncharacterized protein YigE (DUF2233 family)